MQEILTLSPLALAAVPVVVGFVQVAKDIGLPSRLAPLASIAAGAGIMALAGLSDWRAVALQGLLVGLAASGLWSGGKALSGKTGGDDATD